MKKLNKVRTSLAMLSIYFFVLIFENIGVVEPIELIWYDRMTNQKPSYSSPTIVISIDESDINKYGSPIDDRTLARALKNIEEQKPRSVGLDLYRNNPVPEGTEEFNELLQNSDRIFGIEKAISHGIDSSVSAPPILKRKNQTATVDVPWEIDERVRKAFLFVGADADPNLPSLPLALAWKYLEFEKVFPQAGKDGWLKLGKWTFFPFRKGDGGYVNTDDGSYQIVVDYRSEINKISFDRIVENKDIPPNALKDKVVIIGNTAPSLNDILTTPIGRISGAEYLSQVTSQIIGLSLGKRNGLGYLPQGIEIIITPIWILVGWLMGRSASRHKNIIIWMLASVMAAIALPILLSYICFSFYFWLPCVSAVIGGVTAAIVSGFYSLSADKINYLQREQFWEWELENQKSELHPDNRKSSERQAKNYFRLIVSPLMKNLQREIDFISDSTTAIIDEAKDRPSIDTWIESVRYNSQIINKKIARIAFLDNAINKHPREFNLLDSIVKTYNLLTKENVRSYTVFPITSTTVTRYMGAVDSIKKFGLTTREKGGA